MNPILYLVIPCYNEETVLPITAPFFLNKIEELIGCSKISPESRILFVDDGSTDGTWNIIKNMSEDYIAVKGISLSKNRGHQNALLAGLLEAKEFCDISISIDCDGQDDINAVDKMVDEYLSGADIVYGVRDNRKSDTWFKKSSAKCYYRVLNLFGANVIYNHADYRLLSKRVLEELSKYKEVNLYLRGMIPLIGFKSTSVFYERHKRLAGKSKYPLRKMLHLAFDGITSLTVKPIHIITGFGFIVALISGIGIVWSVVAKLMGHTVAGWTSIISIICFLGGIQLLSLGVIGEYVGKIYLETKNRPRYVIKDKTPEDK